MICHVASGKTPLYINDRMIVIMINNALVSLWKLFSPHRPPGLWISRDSWLTHWEPVISVGCGQVRSISGKKHKCGIAFSSFWWWEKQWFSMCIKITWRILEKFCRFLVLTREWSAFYTQLIISCEELTHWKRLWCWEGLGAGGERDDRGWDGWMASPTRWTCVWVNSGSWW